jgi:acyl-CoA reductase-like NAD-dependent aldehyde dehydrogenase
MAEISEQHDIEVAIVYKWEAIGIQLGVADKELDAFREKHGTVPTYAFRDMIRVWEKQDNPPPTWSNFVKALERLNIFQKLADQLRSKYGTSNLIITWCAIDDPLTENTGSVLTQKITKTW